MTLVPSLPYDHWIEEAMRGVIHRALTHAATEGMPGAHHFYVSFATPADGVDMPPDLRARYPDEMTIVLQHQYWDLLVGETEFEVTLRFRGVASRLRVPFAAITGFVDPSVNFALQFRPTAGAGGEGEGEPSPAIAGTGPQKPSDGDGGGQVITLDSFRKK